MEFLAENAVLNLVDLLLMSFSIMEHNSVAFLDGLTFELCELEIYLQQLTGVAGRHDHAPLFLRADRNRNGVEGGDQKQRKQQVWQGHWNNINMNGIIY